MSWWATLVLNVLPVVWLVGYVSWRDTGLSLGDEARVLAAVVDNFVAGLATAKGRRRMKR